MKLVRSQENRPEQRRFSPKAETVIQYAVGVVFSAVFWSFLENSFGTISGDARPADLEKEQEPATPDGCV